MHSAANPAFNKSSSQNNDNKVFIESVYGQSAYLFCRFFQNEVNFQLYRLGWLFDLKASDEIISKAVIFITFYGFKDVIKKVLGKVGYELL